MRNAFVTKTNMCGGGERIRCDGKAKLFFFQEVCRDAEPVCYILSLRMKHTVFYCREIPTNHNLRIIVLCTSCIKYFVYQRAEGEFINRIFNATSA